MRYWQQISPAAVIWVNKADIERLLRINLKVSFVVEELIRFPGLKNRTDVYSGIYCFAIVQQYFYRALQSRLYNLCRLQGVPQLSIQSGSWLLPLKERRGVNMFYGCFNWSLLDNE